MKQTVCDSSKQMVGGVPGSAIQRKCGQNVYNRVAERVRCWWLSWYAGYDIPMIKSVPASVNAWTLCTREKVGYICLNMYSFSRKRRK